MTTIAADPASGDALRARPAGLVHDVSAIAGRALRAVPRDLEAVIPPVFIAVFFFLVNIATLGQLTEQIPGLNYEAFQMATALVLDVQDGYLDRMLLTPVKRTAILLGHMAADVTVAAALTLPIILIGLILGVRFEGGPLGMVVFVGLAALWSLAFAGFAYAIALKTGNPAAVNSSFLLFFPFLFLTSSYVPRSELSGWLDTVATFNPVTYLLEGLRSLVLSEGWQWDDLGAALLAIAIVGAVSMTLCFAALRGRVARG
jgi:ABC-2 type transport system permease protein